MGRLMSWTLDLILRNSPLFWTCFVVNLLGSAYGIFIWYKPSIDAAPPWAWVFIPVCPLAALAGSATLLGLRYGVRWPALYALTAFACIKWGLWTLAFWTRQWTGSGEIQLIEVALVIAHIGLICEGLLFVPRIGELAMLDRALVLGWFWLSFYIHYGLGFYPPLTSHVSEPYTMWLSLGLLVPLSVALLLLPAQSAHAATSPVSA